MPSFRLLPLMALLLALAPAAAFGQDRALAYRGATLETLSDAGAIERGTIVLRDGKIEAVGPVDEIEIPEDALIIDATGKVIMPGIVEPLHTISAGSGSTDRGSRVIIIGDQTVILSGRAPGGRAPTFTKAADVFYPYDSSLKALLRSGLTNLNLVPDDGYGQAAVARLTPDEPEAMLLKTDGILYVSATNDTTRLQVLRSGLESARRGSTSGRGTGGGGRGPGGGPPGDTPSRPGGPPSGSTPSPSQQIWREVYQGETPLFVSASNAAAILYVLESLKDAKDVRLILSASSSDVYETLDALKDRKVQLLLRPEISFVPNSRNRINIPRFVHEAGLELAFTQTSNRFSLLASQDAPLFPIGYLVKTGLPREVALQSLTRTPAKWIGMEESLGSLEPDKSATLLIFEGDPLDPYSRLENVLIEGRNVYEN